MFTGIIKELGKIKNINSNSIEIFSDKIIKHIKSGSSVSINGACLTVTQKQTNYFSVDVMPETLAKTTLQDLKPNDLVNLEPSLTLKDELGGHLVQGHIDCPGQIINIKKQGNSQLFTIQTPQKFLKYIACKGSITIDGISLTIAQVSDQDFTVAIIPFTIQNTSLSQKQINSKVNIEVDLISRYLEKLTKKPKTKITLDFLNKHSYL